MMVMIGESDGGENFNAKITEASQVGNFAGRGSILKDETTGAKNAKDSLLRKD